MNPLVSIIIPTFNYGRYVQDAVDSALAQTYPHVEVIVVDDGSTDDTKEQLAPYGDRIRYVYQDNQGLSAARNTGIRAARGEWISFLDSDDALHPRKTELQLQAMETHSQYALLACHSLTSAVVPAWQDEEAGPKAVTPISLLDVATKTPFAVCSVLVKKTCFDAVGDFDVSLRSVEDRDMWVRIAAQFPVGRLERSLAWYRQTPGSMSRNLMRMEEYDQLVLRRSFALPGLAPRRVARRKAFARMWTWSAWAYMDAGDARGGFYRAVRSLLAWPLPYRQNEYAFLRGRILARTGLQLLQRSLSNVRHQCCGRAKVVGPEGRA
jgi:glycosyltransferase involved in cell wall biosynthesis